LGIQIVINAGNPADLDAQLFSPSCVDTDQQAGCTMNPEIRSLGNSKTWRKSSMVKKIAMAALLALTFLPAASFAQVIVRIAPPAPIVERRPPPPDRGYVWIDGYHRWDGARYVWVGGRWDRPPHPGQRWVAHRWVHRGDHWEMVEGHWR
jgi:hypothetical protein